MRRRKPIITSIPDKANRVLHLVCLAIVLLIFRVWHLSVIQYEEKLEESRRPQTKEVWEPAKRGTIRDRFNIPLAVNRLHYQAAILYSPIREIPVAEWEKEPSGKKVKRWKRKEYIAKLSEKLGEELDLDPKRLEDLIHAKAALYFHLPFIIKEPLTEEQYFRIKMLERDWPGVQAQCIPKRHYPKGRVAADVIGYMGAMDKGHYESILRELRSLQDYEREYTNGEDPNLPEGFSSHEEAMQRFADLQHKAYTIHDEVGKMGVEGRFEEVLRGFHGKRKYFSDARGNFLKELPDSQEPYSGQRILLSLSAELQEFAEEVLIKHEKIRQPRVSSVTSDIRDRLASRSPWIKGGAIVALEPKSGEVLALASFPRFDPNDFILTGDAAVDKMKRRHIQRWFESDTYLGDIWDQKRPLEREVISPENGCGEEEILWMTWDAYLGRILPPENPVREALANWNSVGHAVHLQQLIERLLFLTNQSNLYAILNEIYQEPDHQPYGSRLPLLQREALESSLQIHSVEVALIKQELDCYFQDIPSQYDKVLLVDLCRLLVCQERFSDALTHRLSEQTLDEYRQDNCAFVLLKETVKELVQSLHAEIDFQAWRNENEKSFLKEKRQEEKLAKRYPKPYIDYLDQQQALSFQTFWEEYEWPLTFFFIAGAWPVNQPIPKQMGHYLKDLATWKKELDHGAHQNLEWYSSYQKLTQTISQFPPELGLEYLQSFRAYKDLQRPLHGRYRSLRHEQRIFKEKHLASAFYPIYGFGLARSYAYRQATTQGSIFKLITAYAGLMQKYNELKGVVADSTLLNPFTIVDVVRKLDKQTIVGFFADGSPIPQYYKGGRLPKSLSYNIGQIDIVRAIETSSNPYFSLIAGDYLENPNDLAQTARLLGYGSKTSIDLPAEISGRVPDDSEENRDGLYALAIGQHSLVVTPLQTAVALAAIANGGEILKPRIIHLMAGKTPFSKQNGPEEGSCLLKKTSKEVLRTIPMPQAVRKLILEGMKNVVLKSNQAQSLQLLRQFYSKDPSAIEAHVAMKNEMVGKTSTAESIEHLDLDFAQGTNRYNHLWFSGMFFSKDNPSHSHLHEFQDAFGEPELVVVVYLRYGGVGRETAPVAAQIAQKWREIKARHNQE